MIGRVVLAAYSILFLSACQSRYMITGNAASLLLELDKQNKALYLTYEFESPVRSVQFSYAPKRASRSGWSVLDSEIDLEGNVLSRIDSKPFQRATIKVSFSKGSTDQSEFSPRAIGDVGLVFFNAYLYLKGIRVTEIIANIARGQVVAHGGFVSEIDEDNVPRDAVSSVLQHVFFGDRTALTHVGNSIIVSRVEPENYALMVIRDNVGPAMQWIDAYFESSGQYRPIIIMNFIDADDSNYAEFSGITPMTQNALQTASGEILLRFEGDSRTWESEVNEYYVQRIVVHELVHFAHHIWWGNLRVAHLWLVEGIADYLAIKYTHSVGGYAGDQTFLSEIDRLAGECLNILETGNFGIARAHPQAGITPYNECGVLAYWFIDGQPKEAHNGDRLGAVLAGMKEMPGTYSVRKLRRAMEAVAGREAWDPVQLLIEGPRSRMWQRRGELLREAGISVPSSFDDPSVVTTRITASDRLSR